MIVSAAFVVCAGVAVDVAIGLFEIGAVLVEFVGAVEFVFVTVFTFGVGASPQAVKNNVNAVNTIKNLLNVIYNLLNKIEEKV